MDFKNLKVAIYVVKQLKNDSFHWGLYNMIDKVLKTVLECPKNVYECPKNVLECLKKVLNVLQTV